MQARAGAGPSLAAMRRPMQQGGRHARPLDSTFVRAANVLEGLWDGFEARAEMGGELAYLEKLSTRDMALSREARRVELSGVSKLGRKSRRESFNLKAQERLSLINRAFYTFSSRRSNYVGFHVGEKGSCLELGCRWVHGAGSLCNLWHNTVGQKRCICFTFNFSQTWAPPVSIPVVVHARNTPWIKTVKIGYIVGATLSILLVF